MSKKRIDELNTELQKCNVEIQVLQQQQQDVTKQIQEKAIEKIKLEAKLEEYDYVDNSTHKVDKSKKK